MFSSIVQSLILCGFSWFLWPYLRRVFVKSDVDNVPGPPSGSFLKGNFGEIFDTNGWDFHREIAQQVSRITSPFGGRQLYTFDPKVLHTVLVKDQHIFEQTQAFLLSNHVMFGSGLLTSHGEAHLKQRKMLNPVFSNNHMRHMMPMFYDVAHKLHGAIEQKLRDGPQEVDILHWMTRAALEMIGQAGLGYSFDPFIEGREPHPYTKSVKKLLPTMFKLAFSRVYLLPTLVKIGSPKFQRFVVDMIPWKNVHKLRDIIDTMDQTTAEIFNGKKRALMEGDDAVAKQLGQGRDIISILMKANMDASDGDRLPDGEVLGQMSTFTFAAMDTTSNALSRIFYLLATHPEVQSRLREEVTEARNQYGDIPHDELSALPYLDAVCRETLRLHPPATLAVRTAMQDAILPLSTPIKGIDGREMHEISVPKDTNIVISILNANTDPKLWGSDSYEWKPERWMSPLPQAVIDAHIPGVYSHLMTFLGGGRGCIGFKFSQLEIKVILSVLVSKFQFSPSEKEIRWEMSFITTPHVKGDPAQPSLPLMMDLVVPP